ncbi:MAG TPA: SRPBCC family protein [Terriglobales bacterium]|nr:SRPBCC family protein [Terriglobales bacterium]
MLYHFKTEQWIGVAIEEVFRFFANPENLPRIMPPTTDTRLLHVNIVPPPDGDASKQNQGPVAGIGSEILTSLRLIPYLPFRRKWTARITEFDWNHYFADVQQEGPFKSFHHRHELTPEKRQTEMGTVIKDVIDYEIGFGPLDPIANLLVSRQLHKTFQYRQAALDTILCRS